MLDFKETQEWDGDVGQADYGQYVVYEELPEA